MSVSVLEIPWFVQPRCSGVWSGGSLTSPLPPAGAAWVTLNAAFILLIPHHNIRRSQVEAWHLASERVYYFSLGLKYN